MRGVNPARACALLLAIGAAMSAQAQEDTLGPTVESLLEYAKARNPEYAGMRLEAEAAAERIESAGALPDPKLRAELMDITRGGQQDPSLLPSRVGSARYTLMQELPWFGKRDLKREIAEFETESTRGRALGTWADISARIKTTFAQQYYVMRNEQLTSEILDLMVRLEKLAQARYASGLAAQQDVIRAQVEQTSMRNELIALETEHHHMIARMNALLGRPTSAPLPEPGRLRPIPVAAKLDYVALADRAQARNPLLSADQARLKGAEKNRDLVYKNRYPDVTLGIAPNQFQNSIKQWDLMVEVSIPLQQGSRRALERESDAMLSAARARREATANRVLAELAENIAGLEAANRTEALVTNSLLPQSELTFKSALAGYENGKVDFATLLDAQRQIRQARQNRIKAQAEGQARLAEIERILGEDL